MNPRQASGSSADQGFGKRRTRKAPGGKSGGSSVPGAAHARCVCADRAALTCTREVGELLMARHERHEKGRGKLLESSSPRCPKATTVALKQKNAFARQTAATIA